jgi:uncharacterized protein
MVRFKRSPTGPGQVIDRRGASPGVKLGVGGGGIAAIILLLVTLLGGGTDLGGLTEMLQPPAAGQGGGVPLDPSQDPDADMVEFLELVLQDAQAMWQQIFTDSGLTYRPTNLVVFDGTTQSGCGGAQSIYGPHYCPADELVYMDLVFLRELQMRFQAEGDTAQAYILAHEVAHHVQHLLGITEQARGLGAQGSVALELQADCFAGVWLHTLESGQSAAVLEEGDLEEALNAAAAVGDDNIQKRTTGRVNPDSFTHGTSEQRRDWLLRGFRSGSPADCDTFSG